MHNTHFNLEDTNPVSYEELGILTNNVFQKIQKYLDENRTTIDIVAPILRSGGVLGSMCAVHFKTTRMLPIQFKHYYNPTQLKQILETPKLLQSVPNSPLILICEGNTSSGTTARYAISEIKNTYPDCKIIYATLTHVYDPEAQKIDVDAYFYGIQTNENFIANDDTCKELGLRKGITVFPWENAQDELDDINAFYEG